MWVWRRWKWATMCGRKARLPRRRSWLPGNRRPGRTGEFWRCGSATSSRRSKDWTGRTRCCPATGRSTPIWALWKARAGIPRRRLRDFREAVHLDAHNVRALYQLALEVERQGGPDSEAQFQQLIEQILEAHPDNLPALLELSRIAAKRGDVATLRSAVDRIAAQSADWPPAARQQLSALQNAAAAAPGSAALQSIFLRNVLMQDPEFSAEPGGDSRAARRRGAALPELSAVAVAEFAACAGRCGDALRSRAAAQPARAEVGLDRRRLAERSGATYGDHRERCNGEPDGRPVVSVSWRGGAACRRGRSRSSRWISTTTSRPISCWPGAGGVRFMRQDSPAKFTDVTAQTKLPRSIVDGETTGAWALDIEADGDLDVLLGAPSGAPTVLRNNGDGTFTPIHPFPGVSGVRQFVWADLDNDGNPDASFLDARRTPDCVPQRAVGEISGDRGTGESGRGEGYGGCRYAQQRQARFAGGSRGRGDCEADPAMAKPGRRRRLRACRTPRPR